MSDPVPGIQVSTGSRLHLGFFSLAGPRRFGGAGLMVKEPRNVLEVRLASPTAKQHEGWASRRAVRALRDFAAWLTGGEADQQRAERNGGASIASGSTGNRDNAKRHEFLPDIEVQVSENAPEHSGLGAGTQIALAVARAASVWARESEMPVEQLATATGRGNRSAIGVYGFDKGGFLVEGGKKENAGLSPLLARLDFPDDWWVLLVTPQNSQGLHGQGETEALEKLAGHPDAVTDRLCRLCLMEMLPAILERDFTVFSQAVFEYGSLVGAQFAAIQGGTFGHPMTSEVADYLRHQGVKGLAQSSWGPTLAVFAKGTLEAHRIKNQIEQTFQGLDVILTAGENRGARVLLL